jgi:hypothetical protein
MDKVQKPSVNECCTPSSEPYRAKIRIYKQILIEHSNNNFHEDPSAALVLLRSKRRARGEGGMMTLISVAKAQKVCEFSKGKSIFAWN